MDVIRVGADTLTGGGWDEVEGGADTVVCMTPGILLRLDLNDRTRLVNMIWASVAHPSL
jgi:hypothetical protein